jgi:hypothetical protein
VLFSNDQVAAFVAANFEPVWEMVREVPIIRIDFGNGKVLTRTLHGNILTSVCTADGRLLDALPGIYAPAAYLDQLDQFRLLAQNFTGQPASARDEWIRKYHKDAAAAIRANQTPARFSDTKKVVAIPKKVIEQPTAKLLAKGTPDRARVKAVPTNGDAAALARWTALAADTKLNETTRRRQIHELLAKEGLVAPARVLKPIYKDVLLADLDDPYLGLGPALFGNYPFAREDEGK